MIHYVLCVYICLYMCVYMYIYIRVYVRDVYICDLGVCD